MNKVIDSQTAAGLIRDGDTVAWTTAGMCGFAETVAAALESRFLETGAPRDLTLAHSCGCGDGKDRGMNHLGHAGLVKRLVSGHTGQAPRMGELIRENRIEGYLLPQGVLAHLWRHIAGGKPGVLSKVGLGTFVDPRLDGGKANTAAEEDLVKAVELEGEEWLLYRTFPVDVAVIRATTADERGNLSLEREALFLEQLSMAQAAKNSGGIVIAQVEYLARRGSLHPQRVKVPGDLVDHVVVAEPEQHMQTISTGYNPALSGDLKVPLGGIAPMPLDPRKVIARRAAMELVPGGMVNLGIGMPEGVSSVAAEEGVSDLMTLTTELGTYGGVPASGGDFATSYNAEAIIDHGYQFDFYDGGGLDVCFLGLAQTDHEGNLNVSKFGDKVVGPGGFINISQNARKVVFCGTFTNGGNVAVEDGRLVIRQEGHRRKFVQRVDQITFSGRYAHETAKPVLFVTERCVFELIDGEVTLTEIAPGLDVERDILAAMDFVPRIADELREMSMELFQPHWGGLRARLIND
ncbi:acyl CoA:acetate/3-ketoacid CoA transferase [Halomonas elongata]|uniref:acyl CoA:acetate/3-ketoacid CoA transferase n=1 Tax=Halomonas elongata TaxID=2746 RepID=UPI00186B8EF3|nr:acyl CoA:acetate/3-ketoacid CoA transferase [Halomonas elongata]MBW5801992.1 acyl CoA:acetate/3-ketoacid CoA transferase [Halomonas elongata]